MKNIITNKLIKYYYRVLAGNFYAVGSFLYFAFWRKMYAIKMRKVSIERRWHRFEIQNETLFRSISYEKSTIAEYFRRRNSVYFHFTEESIEAIVNIVPQSIKDRAIKESDRFLENRFEFRGFDEYHFGDTVDWHYWHDNHVSWHYDLNRHDFFITLGMAFHYTKDTKYIDGLYRLWISWIEQNPPTITGNWKEPFEVATRLRNWIWAFYLILYSGNICDKRIEKIIEFMYYHALYLRHNLELHFENNHLFLQSKVLLEYSLLFQEFDHHSTLWSYAHKIFVDQCKKQILSDGGHSELCSIYHRIVCSEIIELDHLLQVNGKSINYNLHDAVKAMVSFSQALARSNGTFPLLGESSADDVNIRFEPFNEKMLNYWGFNGSPLFNEQFILNNKKSHGIFVFPDTGYGVIRCHTDTADIHCLLDFGKFIKNSIPFHGHSDMLHVSLYAHGYDIFIDPGFYYSMDETQSWVEYFASTFAHNTVTIDGNNQSHLYYDTGKLIQADVSLVGTEENKTEFAITAQCKYRVPVSDTIHHKRTLTLDCIEKIVTIHDRISGNTNHTVTWSFHCGPRIKATIDNDNKWINLTTDDGHTIAILSMHCSCSVVPKIIIYKGSLEPKAGWAAFSTTKLQQINTITFSVRTDLPCTATFSCKILI